MRLATVLADGEARVGIIDAEAGRVDVLDGHGGMLDLIEAWAEVRDTLVVSRDWRPFRPETLLAPIPVPRRNLFCVGKNYRAHAREFAASGYDAGAAAGGDLDPFPAVFTKPPSTVVGPGAVVPLHRHVTRQVDYEAELAVIIGRPGRDIPREAALDHVFGYAILNDVTARDRQRDHRQWFLGKALDGFCPMGPWITTADEVDAGALDIRCWVNGDLRQAANTRDLIFDIPSLIATLSAGLTLQAGDIIATGTPAGVGVGFDPPRFLSPGDRVRIEIGGLGVLENGFG